MIGHLSAHRGLHSLLDHAGQQTTLAGQLQALFLSLLDEPGDLRIQASIKIGPTDWWQVRTIGHGH